MTSKVKQHRFEQPTLDAGAPRFCVLCGKVESKRPGRCVPRQQTSGVSRELLPKEFKKAEKISRSDETDPEDDENRTDTPKLTLKTPMIQRGDARGLAFTQDQVLVLREKRVMEFVERVIAEIQEEMIDQLATNPETAAFNYQFNQAPPDALVLVANELIAQGWLVGFDGDATISIMLPAVTLLSSGPTVAVSGVRPL